MIKTIIRVQPPLAIVEEAVFLFEPVGVDSGQSVYQCGFAMIHMACRSDYAHGFLLLGTEYKIRDRVSKPEFYSFLGRSSNKRVISPNQRRASWLW